MSTIECIQADYSIMSDAPLIMACVIGYFIAHFCRKYTAAPAVVSSKREPEEKEAPQGSQAVAALPTEVQAQIAKLAGLQSFGMLACTSSAHHQELAEKDAVWAHVAGRCVSAAEFRRESVGLDYLEEHTLNCEKDVERAEKMLRGSRVEDHMDEAFVGLFERTAAESHELMWNGVGEAGVSIEKLGNAALARTDLFSEDQRDDIARLVGEHEETTKLCSVQVYPEEDFSAVIRDDMDRALSNQFNEMYEEMNMEMSKGF